MSKNTELLFIMLVCVCVCVFVCVCVCVCVCVYVCVCVCSHPSSQRFDVIPLHHSVFFYAGGNNPLQVPTPYLMEQQRIARQDGYPRCSSRRQGGEPPSSPSSARPSAPAPAASIALRLREEGKIWSFSLFRDREGGSRESGSAKGFERA
jgi:hypothetical protein